jgi:hypothetical protein
MITGQCGFFNALRYLSWFGVFGCNGGLSRSSANFNDDFIRASWVLMRCRFTDATFVTFVGEEI